MDGSGLLERKRIAAFLAAAALAGCASFESLSPGTPAQQVQDRVGAPSDVWKSPDGSEVWEYALGPLGTQTYMVSLGPDRAVREVRQVLNDENVSRIKPGMTRDEVRRIVGRPGTINYAEARNEEVWNWRYREWGSRLMDLYVQFDRPSGAVKGVTRFQIDTGGDKRQ